VKVNPLRSVGARLSLALLLVVAGSLALVYLVVIPSLESRLIDSKIHQLRKSVHSTLMGKGGVWSQDTGSTFYFASDARDAIGARVAVFRILSAQPSLTITVQQDSSGLRPSNDIEDDPIALRTALSGNEASGTVVRRSSRYAEVAFLLPDGEIGLVSSPLSDTLGAVSVARQRLLIAGAIVLAVVLVVGYFAAWLFTRRIRRLESAADRIASGVFDEPIIDDGQDEIGELARTFERMRERLAHLDRARREFIANASHELRTPLFALGGFLELLENEDLDEATRDEFLTTMRDQVKRLSKLATELLDLSRLDAGHIDLAREPVSLAATARLVVDDFAAVARRSGHFLRVEADETALAVGDEQRIVQIVRNLVENALMHTPGGTTVRLRTMRLPTGVALSVEDDGPGIPREQREHVFERFYRGDGSQASGSGLGLAIAQELAEAMGGTLELESRMGRTVFSVMLPAAEPERRRPLPEPTPVEA
jgi:signal transduction histidine kinase